MNPVSPASAAAPVLPFRLYFGWGLGTLGMTSFMVGGFLLLRFMTDYMGVPAALAGTIFAAAKLYDGIADPIFGNFSDRTRTRWGRRRPYLLAGSIACGLSFMLAFNAPVIADHAGALVMFALLLFMNATAYAIFAVPYMAMPAEMTDDPDERSKLMSWRVINGALGNLVGGWGTTTLIAYAGGGLAGHRLMGVVVGLAIFVVLFACFVLTSGARRRDVDVSNHPSYREQLRAAAGNRAFVLLQSSKLLLMIAAGLHTATAAFFVQRRLEASDAWLGVIYAMLTVGTVLSQPFWLWLSRRAGKRNAYSVAGLYTAATWLLWLPFGAGTSGVTIYTIGLLAGIGNGGIVMIAQSMLPDTIEYQYRCTGMRIEGSFAGVYIMVEKLGLALGASIAGVTLGAFGYVASRGGDVMQTPAAVQGIALCYAGLSALALLVSVAIIRFYPLDERSMTLRGAEKEAAV